MRPTRLIFSIMPNFNMKFKQTQQIKPALLDVHIGDVQVQFSNLATGVKIIGPAYAKLYSAKGWNSHKLPQTGFAPLMTQEEAKIERERIYEQLAQKRDGNGTAAAWGIEAMDAFLDLEHVLELIHLKQKADIRLKVQLTYNHQNHLATGCRVVVEEKDKNWHYDQSSGMSEFGKMVARLLAQNGIIVDVSHLNRASALEACQAAYPSGRPVIASHANTRVVFSNKNKLPEREQGPCAIRALDDVVISAVLQSGGFIGITPHPYLLFGKNGEEAEKMEIETETAPDGAKPTLRAMASHLEHVRRIAQRYDKNASGSVALASDSELLDAEGRLYLPAGYTPQTYPELFLELGELLRGRNWSENEIAALMGKNAARVFKVE
ncbi:Membrane dipeptidase (Peptidase family M19) [uncultured archaeon]|nr:Membrane dipeptidase (Peptidase family M19) [uncultured archaeon]